VLNLMQLGSPESAILSAIIFNALIIVALVPLALRGQPAGLGRQPAAPQPADLRRRRPDSAFHRYQADRPGHHRPGTGVMKTPRDGIHGQIVHPYIGIKLIDLVITGLGWCNGITGCGAGPHPPSIWSNNHDRNQNLLTLTLLLGVAYPLAVTGLASCSSPGRPTAACSPTPSSRWSAAPCWPRNSSGPTTSTPALRQRLRHHRWRRQQPGDELAPAGRVCRSCGRAQPEARVPALLTRSASGLDPHLPLDAALAQVDRVAEATGLDPVQLTEQVKSAAQAGILGRRWSTFSS
jgi:K+-transporting ATPase ATPase C chain